jgi:hypothetical protein
MTPSTLAGLALALAIAGPALAQAPRPPTDKAPWGALTDTVAAGEIVLRDVCLPGILERRPLAELALYERLVEVSSRAANADGVDKVWRLANLNPVYAVAWADGSCSTYVDRGPSEKLRSMAEATILARPEGFKRGASGPVEGRSVERTVFCARAGEERLVATITTPIGRPPPGVRALSSTVYRARGDSPLCASAP